MLNTKFSEKEMTEICQILKRHGTDCATLMNILEFANRGAPNDAIATYKHVRLMKEFGIINDRTLLCHQCMMDVINHHAETCEEHKEKMADEKYFIPCPDSHYDYSTCESAKWMVDASKIHRLEMKAARKAFEDGKKNDIYMSGDGPVYDELGNVVEYRKDVPYFGHLGRKNWLEETFPDIDEQVRFNPWTGFFCEKHVGSMRLYADLIVNYK